MNAKTQGFLLGAAIVLLAWCRPGLAQPSPASQRVVGFTVFATEAIDGLGYTAQPGGAVVPLRFYPTARSPRYELRGRQPLRLVAIGPDETVSEIVIPDPLREVLLLVTTEPAGANPRRYRVTVVDDDSRQRGPGQIQLLNLSGLELTAELNGRRVASVAGLNPAQDTGRSTRLVLRTTFRGRSYLSWHDTITLGPRGRALVVLFPPFQAGSLEVQTRVLVDEPNGGVPQEHD